MFYDAYVQSELLYVLERRREAVREQSEVHVRVEWALRVGLSRHSDISVHKWSTLQERPTRVSPPKLPSIPVGARTCTQIHFSYRNTHLHHHDLSVRDCLLGQWGEGKETGPAAANIPSLASSWRLRLSNIWAQTLYSPIRPQWCLSMFYWYISLQISPDKSASGLNQF